MSHSRAQRRTVLFVAPELPHAPLTGAHTRPLSIIRALRQEYEVVVVGAAPAGADIAALEQTGAEIVRLATAPYDRPPGGAALARARRFLSPVPLLSRSSFEVMAQAVRQAVRDRHPDAMHLVSMYSCWYRQDGVPAVVDLVDVVSGLCAAAAAARPWQYGLARLQQRTSARIERRELARMAAVMTINDDDRRRLLALGVGSTVAPLAIAIPPASEIGAARSDGAAAPLRLLFVGNFLHEPNRAAARFIQRALGPELKKLGLRAALTIAGHRASQVRGDDHGAGIEYLDDVPDLSPLYRAADIVLVPLPFGGGTKNKTLEALAWGKPVVGSPQAFTGIDRKSVV